MIAPTLKFAGFGLAAEKNQAGQFRLVDDDNFLLAAGGVQIRHPF